MPLIRSINPKKKSSVEKKRKQIWTQTMMLSNTALTHLRPLPVSSLRKAHDASLPTWCKMLFQTTPCIFKKPAIDSCRLMTDAVVPGRDQWILHSIFFSRWKDCESHCRKMVFWFSLMYHLFWSGFIALQMVYCANHFSFLEMLVNRYTNAVPISY